MKHFSLISFVVFVTVSVANTAFAGALAINVKNASKTPVFISWDDTGRCGKIAKCRKYKEMQDPKDGLLIQPGAIFSFGADGDSVQVGDATTAHIFAITKNKIPRVQTSSKTFGPAELVVDKDLSKSGFATLTWTGSDLKKDQDSK